VAAGGIRNHVVALLGSLIRLFADQAATRDRKPSTSLRNAPAALPPLVMLSGRLAPNAAFPRQLLKPRPEPRRRSSLHSMRGVLLFHRDESCCRAAVSLLYSARNSLDCRRRTGRRLLYRDDQPRNVFGGLGRLHTNDLTSEATTAKPLPALPARAASIVADGIPQPVFLQLIAGDSRLIRR